MVSPLSTLQVASLADRYRQLLRRMLTPPCAYVRAFSQELHPGIWEATAVDEAVAASGFGLAVSAGFAADASGGGGGAGKGGGQRGSGSSGSGGEPGGCSAVEAIDQLLLFYGPAGTSYIDELEHEIDFADGSGDNPASLRRTTAVSLLLAATGPGGQRAARRTAAREW